MIKQKLGHKLDGWVRAGFPFLFARSINPDMLTVIGTLICLAGAVAFGLGELLIGGLLLWAGGMFDLVDGVVARHFQRSSVFGAFLDSTLDRLVDMSVFMGLVVLYARQGELVAALLAGIVLISSVLTSYTKARAEALHLSLPGGIVERGERITITVAGAILGLMVPALWLLAVGSTATVVQRFMGAWRGIERLESAARAHAETGRRLAHGE